MAKKNKNKGSTQPRNEKSLNNLANLSKMFYGLPETEITPSVPQKKKLPFDLSYPDHPAFYLSDSFLNCYNFIPLPLKDCQKKPVTKGQLTGSIHCSLTPKTDIFIPNTSNETCLSSENMGETVREFFSYTQLENKYKMTEDNAPDHPVIPGSELRGMIRSMYEAFTNSCMSALDFEKPLSSRVSTPFSPAILKYENDSWKLYEASKYNIPVQKQKGRFFISKKDSYILDNNENPIYSYDKVKFSLKKDSKIVTSINGSKDLSEGYVVIGEAFSSKKNEFIFLANFSEQISSDYEKLENAIQRYNSIIADFYRDSKINKAVSEPANFYKGREIPLNPENGTMIPVWYHQITDTSNNRYLYLSPACIGREIFVNNFSKFTYTDEPCTDEPDSYKPCSKSSKLCPCCRLFGMIGENSSIGSRLRFSDAKFTGEKPKYSPITTLKELSTPKPTSMEVYTHIKKNDNTTNGAFWNYDIYTSDGKTFSPASEYISINGRKMYYHHPECKNSRYYAYTPSSLIAKNRKRLVTVRPLKGIADNKFEFDIFFEHITESELKMLLIVTSLLFNDSDYCYKIGMGKPIGLGSIKIKVENVKLRTITMSETGIDYNYDKTEAYTDFYRYTDATKDIAEEKVRSFLKAEKVIQSVFKEIKKMTYFHYADEKHNPQYPTPIESDEIFKWFSNNRKLGGNRRFEQTLDNSGVLKNNQKK